jgi:pimeloyl-ACP methyl ester carboxylesterase
MLSARRASPGARQAQTLRLPGGRDLGYAEWGSGDGDALLYLHGGLGSRLERHREDERYRDLGVRLITVDRPDHGLSTYQPTRTLQGFADDLASLLDHLALAQVALLGYSAGGIYALAFAERHAQRVRSLGVLSGLGVIHRPGGMDGLVPRFQRTYRNARDHPLLARAEMRANVAAFRYAPKYAFKQISDRKVTSLPQVQQLIRAAILEGARNGVRGVVTDVAVATGPLGFEPLNVRTPVKWWHGNHDSASPVDHAEHLTSLLPDAELNIVKGGGHFMAYTLIEDVFAQLR